MFLVEDTRKILQLILCHQFLSNLVYQNWILVIHLKDEIVNNAVYIGDHEISKMSHSVKRILQVMTLSKIPYKPD